MLVKMLLKLLNSIPVIFGKSQNHVSLVNWFKNITLESKFILTKSIKIIVSKLVANFKIELNPFKYSSTSIIIVLIVKLYLFKKFSFIVINPLLSANLKDI